MTEREETAKEYSKTTEGKAEEHKKALQDSIIRETTGGFNAEIFGRRLGVEPLKEEDMVEIMRAVDDGMLLVQEGDKGAIVELRERIAESSDEYPPKVDDLKENRSKEEREMLDFCKNLRNYLGKLTTGGFGKMADGSKRMEAYKLTDESLQYVKTFIPSVFRQEIGTSLSGQADIKKEYVFVTTQERGEESEQIIEDSPGKNFDVIIKAGNYLVVDLNGVKLTLVYPQSEVSEGEEQRASGK